MNNDHQVEDALARLAKQRIPNDVPSADAAWTALDHRRRVARRQRRLLLAVMPIAAAVVLATALHVRGARRDSASSASRPSTAAASLVAAHFARTSRAIQSVASSIADGRFDTSLVSQVRDLQVATRRMQGGHIAPDTATAVLLADVDFVLSSIVSLDDADSDRNIESNAVAYSIRSRNIVARLESASKGNER